MGPWPRSRKAPPREPPNAGARGDRGGDGGRCVVTKLGLVVEAGVAENEQHALSGTHVDAPEAFDCDIETRGVALPPVASTTRPPPTTEQPGEVRSDAEAGSGGVPRCLAVYGMDDDGFEDWRCALPYDHVGPCRPDIEEKAKEVR